jgi:hypothetical protein
MIGLEKTKTVVRMFKTVSDGTHANTRGFHGSLTAHSLQKLFHEIDPYGRIFLDVGFGTGVVLAAALTSGASKVHGFELPGNEANQYIFKLQCDGFQVNYVESRNFLVDLFWNSTTS